MPTYTTNTILPNKCSFCGTEDRTKHSKACDDNSAKVLTSFNKFIGNNMEWISVKDRLPEEQYKVLVINKELEMFVAYLCLTRDKIVTWDLSDKQWIDFKYVTHWMPLPEKPKE